MKLVHAELLTELRRLRRLRRPEGSAASPSVTLLRDLLSVYSGSGERYFIYSLLVGELMGDDDIGGALDAARCCLAESDDPPARCSVGRLLLRLGCNSEAIGEFRIAYSLAVKSNTLINYAFGEFMRAALTLSNREIIETISDEFLDLEYEKSKEDCCLETDWLDAARGLGVRPELIDKLRSRATELR